MRQGVRRARRDRRVCGPGPRLLWCGVSDPLAQFGAATRTWFAQSFAQPTAVQERGWASIASGQHTLMLAPTGSGKTQAAFLWCLDRLTRLPADALEGTRVVYVSPIKALAYDIE